MGLVLLGIFIIVPVIEIAILIEAGRSLGLWVTIGLIIATAVIGSFLIRLQGMSVMSRLQSQVNAGQAPVREMIDGAALLVSGLMLLTPGFFTDTIGFLLLVPPIRYAIAAALKSRMTGFVNMASASPQGRSGRDGMTIDGEAEEINKDGGKSDITPQDAEKIAGEKNPNSPWRDE